MGNFKQVGRIECYYFILQHCRFSRPYMMFQKTYFSKPRWRIRPRPALRSNGAKFAKWKNFFFHRNKNLYLLFCSRMSLILCCCFLRLNFFGIFVKCFCQFGYAKFHSLCDFKLAIIKLSAYPSTYGLLIKWLIFCCRVNFYGRSLR